MGERLHAPGDEPPSLPVSRLTIARTSCSRTARESSGLRASLRPAPLTCRHGAVLAGGGSAPCHLGHSDDDEGDHAVVYFGEPIHSGYVLIKRGTRSGSACFCRRCRGRKSSSFTTKPGSRCLTSLRM